MDGWGCAEILNPVVVYESPLRLVSMDPAIGNEQYSQHKHSLRRGGRVSWTVFHDSAPSCTRRCQDCSIYEEAKHRGNSIGHKGIVERVYLRLGSCFAINGDSHIRTDRDS